jgi:hypothetical protein
MLVGITTLVVLTAGYALCCAYSWLEVIMVHVRNFIGMMGIILIVYVAVSALLGKIDITITKD